jgi:hypothetical protein
LDKVAAEMILLFNAATRAFTPVFDGLSGWWPAEAGASRARSNATLNEGGAELAAGLGR